MASDPTFKTDTIQGGSQDSVESLVKHLISRVEDSERRYSQALEDLHSRLDQLSQATQAAKSASGSDDSETLDRLHEQVSSLAKRLSETESGEMGGSPDSDLLTKLAKGSEPYGDAPSSDFTMTASEPETPAGGYEHHYSGPSFFGVDDDSDRHTPEVELPALVPDEDAPSVGGSAESRFGTSGFDQSHDFDFSSDFDAPAEEAEFQAAMDDDSGAALHAQAPYRAASSDDTDYARRLYDAAQRLEGSLGTIVPNDQIESLNAKMDEIANQLDRALQRSEGESPQPDALQNIEQQLAEIGQQLGRTETEVSKIGTIEAQLTQLMEHIDTQPSMEDVAERAADSAAQKIVGEVKSSAAERLEAIHKDLTAMNERSATTDDRLADTLGAVHESLKQLVEQAGKPSPAPIRRAPFADAYSNEEDASFDEPPAIATQTTGDVGEDMPVRSEDTKEVSADRSLRSQLAQVMPEEQDDEPSGPFGRKGTEPAADEPRRPMAYSDDNEGSESSDSFVAAARRAAQAAAAQAEQSSSWGDKKKKKREKALPGSTLDLEEQPKKKKRSYLMYFAILLLIVSAALLYSRLGSKPEDGQEAAPAAEEQAPAEGSGDAKPEAAPDGSGTAPEQSGRLDKPIETMIPRQKNDVDVGHEAVPEPDLPGFKLPTLPPTPASVKRGSGPDLPPGVSLTVVPNSGGDAKDSKAGHAEYEEKLKYPMPDTAAGTYALRRAAATGDAKAQYLIGLRYSEGDAGLRDMEKSLRWLRLAATAGLAPAQYRLGVLYERGEGVEFDLNQARAWYGRAASKGNLKAMHNLAVIEGGKEGNGDYTDAAKWYAKAAAYGLSDSQFNLGVLKEHGLGTSLDLVEAYKWFSLAAASGDTEAAKRRDVLRDKLTGDQLAKAEAAVGGWKPKPAEVAANEVEGEPAWMADATEPSAALISKAQALLNDLGYEAGPVDGALGNMTRNAILDFERRNGLPETGEVSIPLVSRLEKLAG
ncbi:Localization factor PodJL [Methyloligella halotolerans]|uniref:Localization factor PodJL n=1 Tax=Methyloligella halotolerans TaxID=1177755 RepID=A0A1E2RXW9_9HYPH|nr:peptidoglycan-binding protein [Methyloligella halotolerans]ODA67073.1 Localization factor PodJL [Methyloligella halotolerans]